MKASQPTYDLRVIQECVELGHYDVTGTASNGLGELGFDRDDLEGAILSLRESDCHKSMESETIPGLWQDVYTPTYCGRQVYIKLQLVKSKGKPARAWVISFKRK